MIIVLLDNIEFMKKILITGGAGFLGSKLIEKLLTNKKNKVICVDNFISSKTSHISKFNKFKNFQFLKKDITKKIDIEADEIYNLASPASPIQYKKNPIETIKTSTIGMINILENAKKYKAKILQASTSEVYGDPEVNPQKESYFGSVNTIGERSCYDESKRLAETLIYNYNNIYNLNTKIVRIFNSYGPNMIVEDGRVVSNFVYNAINDKDLILYGKGLQTRSFCYVDDTIRGIIKMMRSKHHNPINIGSTNEITIKKLAETILQLTNSKSRILYKKLIDKDDPKKRCPDINLAKKALKWEPEVSLKEGLIKTIKYFKSIN